MSGSGRPTMYTQELAQLICDRIAEGESLVQVCLDNSMPCRRTVYYWFDEHSEFLLKYERARDMRADFYFDMMFQEAYTANPDDVQVKKLIVDTLKWGISRMAPKKYGDKQEVDMTVREFVVDLVDED